MIITLKGADFSKNNIGPLSSWLISREIGYGARYSGPVYVSKGGAFSATVVLAEGYTLDSAGVTVIMGGTAVTSGVTVNGNTITINIASVTGSVVIKVPTLNTNTGEEDGGGTTPPVNPPSGTTPSSTTWYIDDCDKYADIFDKSANIVYYGFAYQSDKMASVYNKPVNAIKVYSSSSSGKLPVYRISATNEATLIKEFTITKVGVHELKFDSTITLAAGENIAVGEINTTGQALIKFSSTATVPDGKFYVKVPSATQSYVGSAGFNIGYVV